MNKEFKKGEYEKAAERAKELLDKGVGLTQIINITGLSEEKISKLNNRIKEE